MKIDLTASPFNLSEVQINWVEEMKKEMSLDEKIGQLFFLAAADSKNSSIQELVKINAGGVMLRPLKVEEVVKINQALQASSKIPMFLAANLEEGANGIIDNGGTRVGHQLLIAATNDPENAFKLGQICMSEAQSVGANMAFAPMLDINFNWNNPIANIRSFGDRPELVAAMSKKYVDGVQSLGGAVTIKHFPGDGVDGRDQHVIKSSNNLKWSDWMATFGKVWKANIDNGATGLMTGHIALPSYFEHTNNTDEDKMVPASLSKVLLNNLLRGELGYNGLIMTDSSLMTGFGAEGRREDLVPCAIANGNDMLLFSKNVDEDFQFMKAGIKNGVISEERLDEALTRILGLKAKLGLNEPDVRTVVNKFNEIDLAKHAEIAKEIADQAITLVRNDEQVLPIDRKKVRKIGIISLGNEEDVFEMLAKNAPLPMKAMMALVPKKPKKHVLFKQQLEAEGFDVKLIDHSSITTMMSSVKQSIADFKAEFDLIIYFIKKDTMSNQTNVRVEYKSIAGFDSPWFVNEIPTMMISVGNPYHQYDLENVKTVINAYTPTDQILEQLVEKMVGKSDFKGVSPVKLEFNELNTYMNIDSWLNVEKESNE